jgi:hypothetical protein
MQFLHYDFYTEPEDVIEVTLDRQANVRLLDDINYSAFWGGSSHRYYGGRALVSPVRLNPPHSGHWNVVIDLGGYGGCVRAGVRVVGHG